jgi:hypothetical protein
MASTKMVRLMTTWSTCAMASIAVSWAKVGD